MTKFHKIIHKSSRFHSLKSRLLYFAHSICKPARLTQNISKRNTALFKIEFIKFKTKGKASRILL